jgi:accessory gene regulator B
MLICRYEVKTMIAWLSGRLAGALAARGAIPDDERDVYAFGLDALLSTAVNLVCVLGIGLLLGFAAEAALYILFFAVLRGTAGGYHAETHLACTLIMLAAFGAAVALLMLLPDSALLWLSISASVVSMAAVAILAPAPHENRPVSGRELSKFRKLSICVSLAGAGAVFLMAALGAGRLAASASLGLITAAASLAAARIRQATGKRTENNIRCA